jgi:hypothetical protein
MWFIDQTDRRQTLVELGAAVVHKYAIIAATSRQIMEQCCLTQIESVAGAGTPNTPYCGHTTWWIYALHAWARLETHAMPL